MAWNPTSTRFGDLVLKQTYTLPTTGVGYSDYFEVKAGPNATRYIGGSLVASAVTGTNLDIALYGADTPTGTKRLLKDAIVADITDTTLAVINHELKANGWAPYFFLGWTVDTDESANTIAVTVVIPSLNR